MHGWYTIVIEAWPYSTGIGATADQERAEPRQREFTIHAGDFRAACTAAERLQDGIKSSGHVYQAPVRSITYRGEARP